MSPNPPVLHVLDADATARRLACSLGEAEGYRAEGFGSPEALLAAARAEPPDLLLLAQAGEGAEGAALLEVLARERCSAALILSSAEAARVARRLGLAVQASLPPSGGAATILAALRGAASRFRPIRGADMLDALSRGELLPWYQPILRIADRLPVGAEALLRWDHPQRGTLGPAAFLPQAEASGAIIPLSLMMLERAAWDCGFWRALGHDLAVAVNLSPSCLGLSGFGARIAGIRQRAGLPTDRLVIELSEASALATPEREAALVALHKHGVALALDDVGTGQATLADLRRLPVQDLKIDRSLIAAMLTDREAMVLVRALVALARALGLRSVAEGVESEAQFDALAAMGCELAQGFLFARPMPAASFLTWLGYSAAQPPSTGRSTPVIWRDRSDAMKRQTFATSSSVVTRPSA